MRYSLKSMQTSLTSKGEFKVSITDLTNRPVVNASVSISYSGDPQSVIERLTTNSSGQTESINLPAPPVELSLEPGIVQPYAEYTVQVEAEGYEPIDISGSEVLADTSSVQPVRLTPSEPEERGTNIVIPAHTLYGDYPPKIAEDEIKPVDESGEIVLSRVVIPETIVVHDGAPSDPSASDYYVSYRDYIKNVASSEIYATWPESTIVANVLAIMSFTLNRVYTEWYRDQYRFGIDWHRGDQSNRVTHPSSSFASKHICICSRLHFSSANGGK